MKGFACKLCGQRKEAQVWIRSLNAWKTRPKWRCNGDITALDLA